MIQCNCLTFKTNTLSFDKMLVYVHFFLQFPYYIWSTKRLEYTCIYHFEILCKLDTISLRVKSRSSVRFLFKLIPWTIDINLELNPIPHCSQIRYKNLLNVLNGCGKQFFNQIVLQLTTLLLKVFSSLSNMYWNFRRFWPLIKGASLFFVISVN